MLKHTVTVQKQISRKCLFVISLLQRLSLPSLPGKTANAQASAIFWLTRFQIDYWYNAMAGQGISVTYINIDKGMTEYKNSHKRDNCVL